MKRLLLILPLLLVPFFGTGQPAEKACFSVPGGFYEESPTLEIFPFYQQHHIRFTTNGNRPTAQSQLYTEPLLLDGSLYSTSDIYTIQISPDYLVYVPDSVQHCIVIRAAVFDQNENCISEVATNSYFIRSLGCDTHGLPAVSLCADTLDLFDYDRGIFVPGVHFDSTNYDWTGNYYQTGDDWERPANVEFYELDNRGVNQQAGLRTHGGNGRRFQQKCVKIYAREQYGKKRFEHRFFETIPQNSFKHLVLKPYAASWNNTGINDHVCNQIAARLNVESLASRPAVLFLNGEYWGIYYVHERPDERFLEDHFGVDIDHVNLISSWHGSLDNGTNANFMELFRWVQEHDLSDPAAYATLCTRMDIDNFIDYNIFELFAENTDWPANNMRCWQVDRGPWRWIFYDGDACLHWMTYKTFDNIVYIGDEWWPSSTKATLFFRRLMANETFKSRFNTRFHELLDTVFSYDNTGPLFEAIKQALAPEIPNQSHRFRIPVDVDTWNTNMGNSQWFLMVRSEYIQPVLEEFMHWSVNGNTLWDTKLYPNPTDGRVQLEFNADFPETKQVEVFDMLGRKVHTATVTVVQGNNALSLDLDLAPGIYVLTIGNVLMKLVRR